MPTGNINGTLTTPGKLSGILTAGVGGTSDYEQLENKPSINDVELVGNLTAGDLGLATESTLSDLASDVALMGQKLPKNYSTEEQNTGIKWIDGKYIYQKSYTFTTPQRVYDWTLLTAFEHNLIDVSGFAQTTSGQTQFLGYYLRIVKMNNGLYYYASDLPEGNMNMALTLYYTKSE